MDVTLLYISDLVRGGETRPGVNRVFRVVTL